jgi:hypothetical protein
MGSAISGFKNFKPEKDLTSLSGRVIFVTGGTDAPNPPLFPIV